MALTRVDQEHLAGPDLARPHTVIEVEATSGHDQRDGYRVAVLRDGLARLQAQADDPHRPAISDLLEAKRARTIPQVGPRIGAWH